MTVEIVVLGGGVRKIGGHGDGELVEIGTRLEAGGVVTVLAKRIAVAASEGGGGAELGEFDGIIRRASASAVLFG